MNRLWRKVRFVALVNIAAKTQSRITDNGFDLQIHSS